MGRLVQGQFVATDPSLFGLASALKSSNAPLLGEMSLVVNR